MFDRIQSTYRLLAAAVAIAIPLSLAWGRLPVVQENTFFIRNGASGVYDVQYWMNDSIPGYAYYWPPGVNFIPQLGDTIHSCHLPASPWGNQSMAHSIRLIRIPSLRATPVVCVLYTDLGNWEHRYLAVIDCYADTLLAFFDLNMTTENYDGPHYDHFRLVTWPPPPSPVSCTIVTANYDQQVGWGPGDSWSASHGSARRLRDGLQYCSAFEAKITSPFRIFSSEPIFAAWNRYYYSSRTEIWEGDSSYYEYEHATHHSFFTTSCHQTGSINTFCVDDFACANSGMIITAQTDGDGRRRFISTTEMKAYDPETWEVLWQRPQISNTSVYTARVPGSLDERILLRNTPNTLIILDASNGMVLDTTEAVTGTIENIIKRRDHPDQIVARQGERIRIYNFYALPEVEQLTIRLVTQEHSFCRLQWLSSVDFRGGYRIEAASSIEGPFEPVAMVPAGQTSYDIPVDSMQTRFFQVIAVDDTIR